MDVFKLPKEVNLEEAIESTGNGGGARFMLDENAEDDADEENEDETKSRKEDEDHAFPPGSDRLDDILDEID